MQHVSFKCSACGLNISAPETMGGEYIECPKCNLSLRVPSVPKLVQPPPSPRSAPPSLKMPAPDLIESDDEDDLEDEDEPAKRRRKRRNVGFQCQFCGSNFSPIMESKISTLGIVILACLLLMTIVLFWIGFFFRDRYPVCSECGIKAI
jgi:DNA-directed RNA polymerase subunit RPC12/RpoP